MYTGEEALGGYAADGVGSDPALDMLASSIPGVPGEDYPIYAEVPETGFGCDGQVDGGINIFMFIFHFSFGFKILLQGFVFLVLAIFSIF